MIFLKKKNRKLCFIWLLFSCFLNPLLSSLLLIWHTLCKKNLSLCTISELPYPSVGFQETHFDSITGRQAIYYTSLSFYLVFQAFFFSLISILFDRTILNGKSKVALEVQLNLQTGFSRMGANCSQLLCHGNSRYENQILLKIFV